MLTAAQQAWIAAADTFFIASGHRADGDHPAFGMDASHRGGDRGFVEVTDGTRLVFPDYAGNNHYNTIGNLAVDPRVGLLFVDFETGSLLQLTGRATIDWDSPAVADSPGARRLVTIDIDDVIEMPGAVALRWDADADSVRSLRLIEKTRESDDVISFVLAARDGGDLPPFEAGQHLPIEVVVPGTGGAARRTYSLSGPPDADRYRISVKRQPRGVASRHLHDHVEPGDFIDARKPAGAFVLPDGKGPVVLVSAGIGATPMVSMLHALAAADAARPVWYVHGARDGRHLALNREVEGLAAGRDNIHVHVAFSQPGPQDYKDRDYDSVGRIDGGLLIDLVSDPNADYMLCGPTRFMAAVQTDLERRGVPASRIHSESFGPAG